MAEFWEHKRNRTPSASHDFRQVNMTVMIRIAVNGVNTEEIALKYNNWYIRFVINSGLTHITMTCQVSDVSLTFSDKIKI